MADMEDFKIERVDKVDKVNKSVEAFKRYVNNETPDGIPADRSYFESLMRQEKTHEAAQTQAVNTAAHENSTRVSLLDEARRAAGVTDPSKPSTVDLLAQTQIAVDRIESIKADLAAPELQIKNSVQRLLKNKLGDINDNLKVAFAKAGLEYVPPEQRGLRTNPLVNFLDMLSSGQTNLERLSGHVEALAAHEDQIRPMDLLAVQIKVSHVQSQLEFFSNLLNKSLESTKTLMNVQV